MNLPPQVVLEEAALAALLVGVLLIFVVMCLVFAYHWRRFGVETPLFRRMRRLHWWVSVVLASLSILLYLALVTSL